MNLSCRAYAKVNLVLEVLGKRSDGYHEIASIMQTVGIYDELSFRLANDIILECDAPDMHGEDNLVLGAARALQVYAAVKKGAVMGLIKSIPSGAGLGGGSSDAAATLVSLNRLWGAGLDLEQLSGIAAGLGSDVPFFLHGGTCLAEGRGEIVTPLPDASKLWFVIFKPPVPVPPKKTAALYSLLGERAFTDGSSVRSLACRLKEGTKHIPVYRNCFDSVAGKAYPGIGDYIDMMKLLSPISCLSGSGPSIFGIHYTEQQAREAGEIMASKGGEVFVVSSVSRDEAGN
jgi:4-diphosphocytidyl-2-C-methyl-D-erythritol kinase